MYEIRRLIDRRFWPYRPALESRTEPQDTYLEDKLGQNLEVLHKIEEDLGQSLRVLHRSEEDLGQSLRVLT